MNEDAARDAAAFASGQLLMRDSTVESAVRSVYRVATLKGQTRWQVWALLQLADFNPANENVEPTLSRAHEVLDALFPDEDQASERDALLERAFDEYSALRRNTTNQRLYSESIGAIEQKRSLSPNDWSEDGKSISACLNRVKNAAQVFLCGIESGHAGPL